VQLPCLFSAFSLEGWETPVTEGNSDDPRLEYSLSGRKISGAQVEIGKAIDPGYKTTQAAWLAQVDGDWAKYLYSHALDLQQANLPAEVKAHLVNHSDMEKAAEKWINLYQFKSVWHM